MQATSKINYRTGNKEQRHEESDHSTTIRICDSKHQSLPDLDTMRKTTELKLNQDIQSVFPSKKALLNKINNSTCTDYRSTLKLPLKKTI